MSLHDELEAAENAVAQIRAKMRVALCSEVGHRWISIGGMNASCGEFCQCSVAVYECSVCKDCDYGENAEAEQVRRECAERNP